MTATAERNEYRLFPSASTASMPVGRGKPASRAQAKTSSAAAYALSGATPGWQIIGQIVLAVEHDDDGFLASDSFSTVYGDGKTSNQAVGDYWKSLINYYQILEAAASGDRSTALAFKRLRGRLVKVSQESAAHTS